MIGANILKIKEQIPASVQLIAVSKTKPVEAIQEAYDAGHRAFGENKVQELVSKYEVLPKDIEWHLIGHLQTNKVKYIAPFVHLIHSVDSLKLLETIDKEGRKNNRIVSCLLQFDVTNEETKFGFTPQEGFELLNSDAFKAFTFVRICGIMGMASNTDNEAQIAREFAQLHDCFNMVKDILDEQGKGADCMIRSYGMSGDYQLAIKQQSNMVRVGSAIFGSR
ncbi:MAG: YggS family pyridoxal phosphate-dependent enzyme [Bacteroidia bacterium]|jgi:hypothetical protein|nr:YggS family pyridoxal phosphate-dependent enzyme [Bacteroidia bacterium]